jgi:hypothetical protein
MLQKFTHFTILLILTGSLYAQISDHDSLVSHPKTIIRLSILTPGFQVEQMIGRDKTIVVDLSTGFSYQFKWYSGNSSSNFIVFPSFSVTPRFYTNQEYRRARNKSTDYYSGTYIAIPLTLIYYKNMGFRGGIEGGFQKKFGNAGFWNIAFGVGNQWWNDKMDFVSIGDFSLGFIIK